MFVDPSDATGFADRLFPARLTGVLADEDGIWHYSWVEMMLGGDGILVESEGGRQGVIDEEEVDADTLGGPVSYRRAIDPSEGAAVEVDNRYLPVTEEEADQPIVWLRLRGFKNGDAARYEFTWDAGSRMVKATEGIGYYTHPNHYLAEVQYLDPTTGDWVTSGEVLVKPANVRNVLQIGLRHIAVPMGQVTSSEEDGIPGMSVWAAIGNPVEPVQVVEGDAPSGMTLGLVLSTGEACYLTRIDGFECPGPFVGVAAGTYEGSYNPLTGGRMPIYEIVGSPGIASGTWDLTHDYPDWVEQTNAIVVVENFDPDSPMHVSYTRESAHEWKLTIYPNPDYDTGGLDTVIDLTTATYIDVENGRVVGWG